MYEGIIHENRNISYVTDSIINIYNTSGNILQQSMMIVEDTRITLNSPGVIIRKSGVDVTNWIESMDNSSINSSIVLINRKHQEKSIIMKKGTSAYPITVIMNQENTNQEVLTMSKF